ncbi:MAG: hypothetical protein ABSE70_02600 [Candidatus Limnocylindrales bacterium]
MNGSQLRTTAPPTGRVRVSLASAERLLGSLPDRSIDLVITDPPYVTVNRASTSGHLRDWFPAGLTWPQIGRVFAVARRKLKADGVLMAMTNNDGLDQAIDALKRAGFSGIRTITWDRQYPGLGGGLRHQTEFVLVGRLPGSRTLAGVDLVSVAAVGPGTAGRYPTAKPDGLGRELAAMAGIGPGSLVVDPFVGSGALLVGALERGASVVGGDVAKRAVRQASARLAQAGRAGGRTRPARPGKPNGSSRRANGSSPARPVTRPAGPGRPNGTRRRANGTSRSSPVTRPIKPGKPNGTSRSSPVTRPIKPGKPNGSSRSSPVTRPVQPGKPNGSSRTTPVTRPIRPGKPNGSSRCSPARSGKPNGTSRSSRTTRPGKPNGSSRSTTATRPTSRGSTRQMRPGSRR